MAATMQSAHGGVVHGVRHVMEDRANCSMLRRKTPPVPLFPVGLEKQLLTWSTKPTVHAHLRKPGKSVNVENLRALGDVKRYGAEDYAEMRVPAAGGNSNLIEFDRGEDRKRVLKGFTRPRYNHNGGAGWGHEQDRPPWSAANGHNPWHGPSASATFPCENPAQTFRMTMPIRSMSSMDSKPTVPSAPNSRKAASVMADRLDFSTTVAFQWNGSPEPSGGIRDADRVRPELKRRVWRVPGLDEGTQGASTPQSSFWQSQQGWTEKPPFQTTRALRDGRAQWDRHNGQASHGLRNYGCAVGQLQHALVGHSQRFKDLGRAHYDQNKEFTVSDSKANRLGTSDAKTGHGHFNKRL